MLAVMAGLLVCFSLGNQKHHSSVDGSVLKADHWLLSCHIRSFSAVALTSVSLLSQEALTALFFPCFLRMSPMFNLCLFYGHSWNALIYYLSKYILVLSIAGTAGRSILLKHPNLPQPIFEAFLGPFDLFWPA